VTELVDLDALTDEETRRQALKAAIADLMFALADLTRKYDEHDARKWSEIRHSDGRPYIALGALAPAVDAFRRLTA
jgi:hypothetical protein